MNPPRCLYLRTAQWLGMPASVWICLILFAIVMVVFGFTSFGRSLYAIGGNIDGAKAAGIRADRVLWIVIVIVIVTASVLAALSGLLLSGRLASVLSAQGSGYVFTVFAAAVIGDISLNCGRGTVFGAFTGILPLFLHPRRCPRTVDRLPQRRDHPQRPRAVPHPRQPLPFAAARARLTTPYQVAVPTVGTPTFEPAR